MSPCFVGWFGDGACEGCATVGRLWVTGMPPGMMPSMAAGMPPGATLTIPGGYLAGGHREAGFVTAPMTQRARQSQMEGRGTERCHLSASIGRGSVAISHFMCVTQLPDPSLCAKLSPIVAINAGTVTYTALPTSSTAGGVVPKPEAGICCNQTLVVFALGWF